MSLFVFLAVLGAALLHASWNAVVRSTVSKVALIGILTIVQGTFGIALAATQPWPEAHVWPWLAASGVFHAGYKLFLALAYERGDLSRVYPIARGAAPVMVLAVSLAVLGENLSPAQIAGIAALAFGIAMMGRGAFALGEDRRLVPLALASAAMTAGYSLIDGLGARAAGNATLFVAWLFIVDALLLTPLLVAIRGRGVLIQPARAWGTGAVAAAASFGAYFIAVWAMTQAPIALVTALRETSILFAILIGWLLFGERMDRQKALAGTLIVAGVAATRL